MALQKPPGSQRELIHLGKRAEETEEEQFVGSRWVNRRNLLINSCARRGTPNEVDFAGGRIVCG